MLVYNQDVSVFMSQKHAAKGLCYDVENLPIDLDYQELLEQVGEKNVFICGGQIILTNFGLLKLVKKLPKIKIAVCGTKNSGKQHLARLIQSRHVTFQIFSFWETLKLMCNGTFDYVSPSEKHSDMNISYNNSGYEIQLIPDDLWKQYYNFVSIIDPNLVIHRTNKLISTSLNQGNDIIISSVKTRRQFDYAKENGYKIVYVESRGDVEGDEYDDFVVNYIRNVANFVFQQEDKLSEAQKIAQRNSLYNFCFKDIDFKVLK